MLDKADIVVTNPPFSLFRAYLKTLIDRNKKFIIVGNTNAVTYKEFFPLIRDNKVWPGFSFNKTMEFIMGPDYELKGKAYVDEQGRKHGCVSAVAWFTNLDIKKRHEDLKLTKKYIGHEDDYPAYDNYEGINVNKVTDIPCDYDGIMGVPITFLNKYNPDQFEILGVTSRGYSPEYRTKVYEKADYDNANDLNGSACVLVGGVPKMIYGRLLIRRKSDKGGETV